MDWFASLLPATVVAAIALFFVKEVVEGIRRWRADARKGRAFRTLLARECELNHWTYKRLKEALLAIQEDFEKGLAAEYSIKRQTRRKSCSGRSTMADCGASRLFQTHALT